MKLNPIFGDLTPQKQKNVKLPKVKLHYAVKNLEGDIPFIELKNIFELYEVFMSDGYFDGISGFDWIEKGKTYDECISPKRAWETVFTVIISNEIFATDSIENAKSFIIHSFKNFDLEELKENITDIWIMEWESYEEAYKYCLDIKETNPLCYY